MLDVPCSPLLALCTNAYGSMCFAMRLFPYQKVLIPPSKKAKPNCLSVINKRSNPFQFSPNWKVLERFCGGVIACLPLSLRCKTQHIVGGLPMLDGKDS